MEAVLGLRQPPDQLATVAAERAPNERPGFARSLCRQDYRLTLGPSFVRGGLFERTDHSVKRRSAQPDHVALPSIDRASIIRFAMHS